MALKHRTAFTDDYGLDWYVLIFDEEYGGATVFDFVVGESGFTLSYEGDINNRSVAVIPSRVSIPFVMQNGNDESLVTGLATAYEGRYFVEIRSGGTSYTDAHIYWRGILLPDLTEYLDEYFPQQVELTAVDDLANLKNVPFKFDPDATGYGKLKGHIANALNKLRPWAITADTHRCTAIDYIEVKAASGSFVSALLNAELNFALFKGEETPPDYTPTLDVLEAIVGALGGRIYWHASINAAQVSGFVLDCLPAHEWDDDLLAGYTINSAATTAAATITRDVLTINSAGLKKAAGWVKGYLNPLKRVERTFTYGGDYNPFTVDNIYDSRTPGSNKLNDSTVTLSPAPTVDYEEGTPLSLRFKFRCSHSASDGFSPFTGNGKLGRVRVRATFQIGQYYAKRRVTMGGQVQYLMPDGVIRQAVSYTDDPVSWETASAGAFLQWVTPVLNWDEDESFTFDFGIDMPPLPADLTSEDCTISFLTEYFRGTSTTPEGVYNGDIDDLFDDEPHEVQRLLLYPTDIFEIDGTTITYYCENSEASANEILELPTLPFNDRIAQRAGGLFVESGGTRFKPFEFRSKADTSNDYTLNGLITREWLLGQSRNIRKQRGDVRDIRESGITELSLLHTYQIDSVKYAAHTMEFIAGPRVWAVELLELDRSGTLDTPTTTLEGQVPEPPITPPTTGITSQQAITNANINADSVEIFAVYMSK